MSHRDATLPTTGQDVRPAGPGPARLLLWRLRGFLTVALLVIVADQGTKALVRGHLAFDRPWPEGWTLIRLARVENTGAAFGILQGGGGFLIAATLLAVAVIAFLLLTLPAQSRLYPVALSLILGGAIGNLIDRIRFGSVTDFIDPTHYPAFNLADSSIVIGVCVLLVLTWRDGSGASELRAGDDR